MYISSMLQVVLLSRIMHLSLWTLLWASFVYQEHLLKDLAYLVYGEKIPKEKCLSSWNTFSIFYCLEIFDFGCTNSMQDGPQVNPQIMLQAVSRYQLCQRMQNLQPQQQPHLCPRVHLRRLGFLMATLRAMGWMWWGKCLVCVPPEMDLMGGESKGFCIHTQEPMWVLYAYAMASFSLRQSSSSMLAAGMCRTPWNISPSIRPLMVRAAVVAFVTPLQKLEPNYLSFMSIEK